MIERDNVMGTYFVQAGNTRRVKIGKTNGVRKRIRAIQTGNPEKINLLFFTKDDIESKMHERFKELRLEGEWFTMGNKIIEYLLAQDISDKARKSLKEAKQEPLSKVGVIPKEEYMFSDVWENEEDWYEGLGILLDCKEIGCPEYNNIDTLTCMECEKNRAISYIITAEDVIEKVAAREIENEIWVFCKPPISRKRLDLIGGTLGCAWDNLDAIGWTLIGITWHYNKSITIEFSRFRDYKGKIPDYNQIWDDIIKDNIQNELPTLQ